eukprot:TRINITY_DN1422_c0_g1_i7.p3 TRINITY_DN1422_c0_g1~~TRINITY_DN1422_c0_g1_i7.p3  ORF type:complete len:142 (-),score=17.60 TRINITY_DN1422_c0_g1_i7:413-838(-)
MLAFQATLAAVRADSAETDEDWVEEGARSGFVGAEEHVAHGAADADGKDDASQAGTQQEGTTTPEQGLAVAAGSAESVTEPVSSAQLTTVPPACEPSGATSEATPESSTGMPGIDSPPVAGSDASRRGGDRTNHRRKWRPA